MKTTLRIFAAAVAFAGLALSPFSSTSKPAIPSHLAVSPGLGPLGLPIPTCDPSIPICVDQGGGSEMGFNF